MLTLAEAEALVAGHLGDGGRARHSAFVAHAMSRLAAILGEDAALWQVVGLVHDLDDEVTAADRSRHGLVTCEWLAGWLPDDALAAIAAHDHRTGIASDTVLAAGLKLADALAVIRETLGPDAAVLLKSPGGAAGMRDRLLDRPYLVPLLSDMATRLGMSLESLAPIVETAPPPA